MNTTSWIQTYVTEDQIPMKKSRRFKPIQGGE